MSAQSEPAWGDFYALAGFPSQYTHGYPLWNSRQSDIPQVGDIGYIENWRYKTLFRGAQYVAQKGKSDTHLDPWIMPYYNQVKDCYDDRSVVWEKTQQRDPTQGTVPNRIFARCEFYGRTRTSWWPGTPVNWIWYKERFPSYISTWFDRAIAMHQDLEDIILDKGLVFVTGLTVSQSFEDEDTFEVGFTSSGGKSLHRVYHCRRGIEGRRSASTLDNLAKNPSTPCGDLQPLLVKFIKMKHRRGVLDGMVPMWSLSGKSEAPRDVKIDNVENLSIPCPKHPVDILLDYILEKSGAEFAFAHDEECFKLCEENGWTTNSGGLEKGLKDTGMKVKLVGNAGCVSQRETGKVRLELLSRTWRKAR